MDVGYDSPVDVDCVDCTKLEPTIVVLLVAGAGVVEVERMLNVAGTVLLVSLLLVLLAVVDIKDVGV